MQPVTKFFILLLLFSNQVSAWTIKTTFENGSAGDKAMLPNKDAFHGHANNSKYTTLKKLSGKQSGSVTSIGGDTTGGFGKWGGSWKFDSNLKQGDEIWFRVWVYYPKDFDFSSSSSEGMKFMRIHVTKQNGDNDGYHHNYISEGGDVGKLYIGGGVRGSDGKTIFENKTKAELRGPSNSGIVQITLGQWHAYEQYVRFDSTPGKGIRRTWYDGQLIMEDKQTATLGASTSYSDLVYMWTYWNGGAPKNQTAYIDDVIITSDQPSNSDSLGNRYIGTGNVKITARPNPPSSVITE